MYYNLTEAPKSFRVFLMVFSTVLSIGFFSGVMFVKHQSQFSPKEIEENMIGNDLDEEATTLKFKKPLGELLTTIHGHILSFSLIFFAVGVLIYGLPINKYLKSFLIIEPFFSVLITFGGMYLLWIGISWFKFLIIISGIFMSVTMSINYLLLLYWLIFNKIKKK